MKTTILVGPLPFSSMVYREEKRGKQKTGKAGKTGRPCVAILKKEKKKKKKKTSGGKTGPRYLYLPLASSTAGPFWCGRAKRRAERRVELRPWQGPHGHHEAERQLPAHQGEADGRGRTRETGKWPRRRGNRLSLSRPVFLAPLKPEGANNIFLSKWKLGIPKTQTLASS